jgi:hypothetical protein
MEEEIEAGLDGDGICSGAAAGSDWAKLRGESDVVSRAIERR